MPAIDVVMNSANNLLLMIFPTILILFFFKDSETQIKKKWSWLLLLLPLSGQLLVKLMIGRLFIIPRWIPWYGAYYDWFIELGAIYLFSLLAVFLVGYLYEIPIRRRLLWMMILPLNFLLSKLIYQTILLDVSRIFYQINKNAGHFYPWFELIIMAILVALFHPIYIRQKEQRLTLNNDVLLTFSVLSIYSLYSIYSLSYTLMFAAPFYTRSFRGIVKLAGLVTFNIAIIHLYTSLERFFNQREQAQRDILATEEELRYHRQNMETYATTRRLKHDLNNQYLVIAGLLENNEVPEALNYVKKNQSELVHEDNFYTPNFTLNYVLNEKVQDAEIRGVTLGIHVLLPENINLENDILAVVLGNLLDNAIAAAARNPQSDQKQVELTLKTYNQNIMLEVRNPFDPVEATSRKDRKIHGQGIRNIKRLVAESNGMYHQETEHDQYLASVVFFDSF